MEREAYAGDLSSRESWDLLARERDAALVDVRSEAEWSFVGVPDLTTLERKPVLAAWQTFPGMRPNPAFVDEVRRAVPDSGRAIMFLCRSGVRSKAAAIAVAAEGYRRCYNIAGGFEGPPDPHRHRGQVGGWKVSGLPWVQE